MSLSNHPRPRRREFTGCWRCRARKVKCDEKGPCSACKRVGLTCDQSTARLVWLGPGNSQSHSYRSTGRRDMHSERTWGNLPPFQSDVVDSLIAECDGIEEAGSQQRPSSVRYNPFSVFSIRSVSKKQQPPSMLPSFDRHWANGGLMHTNPRDRYLFHHYVTHVATHMMPFEHSLNPWKLYYPSVSMQLSLPGEKALYHALLAHAAFSLAHLSGTNHTMMDALAVKHYNASIRNLNQSLQSPKLTHGCTSILAAIMTLMMAEVYSGQSQKWQHHLQGAWALLLANRGQCLWKESNFACFSTQSLLIIRIIGATCALSSPKTVECAPTTSASQPVSPETRLASAILSTDHCGFTIGAQQTVLKCIAIITTIGRRLQLSNVAAEEVGRTITYILSLLDASKRSAKDLHDLARYQLNAFIFATYIYLYRTLLDVPPSQVSRYVSLTFENTAAFRAQGGGNFSLWPAFIAAVEAYTVEDMQSARAWLDRATCFGLGNRMLVRRIVEEVWRRREQIQRETGADLGLISVDRRVVAEELDIDVLLV